MNVIRNRILTEETYIKVIAAFTGIGTAVGMYDGLKNLKSTSGFKDPLFQRTTTEKIMCIARDGFLGGGIGLITGVTIPVWLPFTTVATGFYTADFIYNYIF